MNKKHLTEKLPNIKKRVREDEFFKMPGKVKRFISFDISLNVISMVIKQFSPFMLTLVTAYFTKNMVLAMIFLVVWLMASPLQDILSTIRSQNSEQSENLITEFIGNVSSKILFFTRNNVSIERSGKKQLMSSAVILSTTKEYIRKRKEKKMEVIESILGFIIFSFSIAALVRIAASQAGENFNMFITIFVVSIIVLIGMSVFFSKSQKRLYENTKVLFDNLNNTERDVQEIEPISNKQSNFLINNLLVAQKKVTAIRTKQFKKINLKGLATSLVIAISLIIAIFLIVFANPEDVTMEKLVNALAFSQAFSAVLSSIMGQISSIFRIVDSTIEYKEKYEKDFFCIMEVYYDAKKVVETNYSKDTLLLEAFEYKYATTGFALKATSNICLEKGKVILLDGKSGTGKSTLIKLISGELRLPKTDWKLKSIKYFNDTSMLGSKNLLEEITLESDDAKIDFAKLEEILIGIRLSEKFKTPDALKSSFEKELSNGLSQRALLARTLYNLEDTDLVCIDEPIGSLDEENAKKVISFIKEYCNRDRNRFLILCTHQHKFIENMIDEKIAIKSISPLESEVIV